jgi:hypothetical protein
MRRRFAGQVLGEQAALPADTLAAATEALKQAQASLKGSRGGRLGPGTQEERTEGSKAVPALPTASTTPVTTTQQAPALDIAGIRSALGIDQLMVASKGAGAYGAQMEVPQFEMPQFEMPQFEMPQFEMPDWENLLSQYMPKTTEDTGTEETVSNVVKPKTKKETTVKVGSKSYDLGTKGGAGLGRNDIRYLQNQGWTASQIRNLSRKAAEGGQRVSTGAQKLIEQLKPKPSGTKKTATQKAQVLSTTARKAIASTASAPIAKTAGRPATKTAGRATAKNGKRK